MSVERFLKQRAVNIAVDGSYTLPNWNDCKGRLRTFACRTTRVSPFRMILDVPVVGKIADRLTSYFRDFGKFGGHIKLADLTRLISRESAPGRKLREDAAEKVPA